MGHLANIRREYPDMVKRLNASVVGLPEPSNEIARKGWQTILELLYTPQEAVIGSKMPMLPASLKTISSRCDIPEKEMKTILDNMADKGIVIDLVDPRTNEALYSLSPPVVGVFELTMMKIGKEAISKKELAEAISVYCGNSDIFAREVHGSGITALGRTLVYDSLLKDELIPQVFEWERAVEVISSAKHLAISNCYCRHKAEHLGKNCKAPIETCFSFNQFADYVQRRNYGRVICKSEAMDILTKCRENSLVHMVDNVKNNPAWLCNCCKCCCGIMKSINTFDFPAANPSNFRPQLDSENCKGCLKCIKLCPVNALSLTTRTDAKLVRHHHLIIDEERCIGCGICVAACQNKILTLGKRQNQSIVPDSAIELRIYRAFERGRLAELTFERGSGWGTPFINLVLNVVCSLPLSKQQIALRQLKSRFISFILKRNNIPNQVF